MPPQPLPSTSQQSDPPLSITPLSISPLSTPKLFSRSHSEIREITPPSSSSLINTTRKKTKSTSDEVRQAINGFYFWVDTLLSPNVDHHLKKTLNPLITSRKINHKDITNPYLFRSTPIATTFVRSAGTRTREVWRFIKERIYGWRKCSTTHSIKCYNNVRTGSRFMFIPVFTGP